MSGPPTDSSAGPCPDPADELVPLDRPAARGPGRRRTALVVLPLLVGLAVAGGVGGRLALSPGGDAVAADGTATCWDGEQVEAVDACTRPRGTDGVAWVFPSFDRDRLECVDELVAHPEYTRPTMWTCAQAVGGRAVEVTYSEVTGVQDALRFLDRLHGPDARSTGPATYSWTATPTPGGAWVASLLLRDLPFSVTVTAAQRSDAVRALERRVRVRPAEGRSPS